MFNPPVMVQTPCSSRSGLLAPPEVGAVHPHAVQDHGAVGEGNDRANAWGRHQAPADRVTPREVEHHPVKRVEVLRAL